MPPGGNAVRAEQMATLRQIAHELLTSARDRRAAGPGRAGRGRARMPWQAANLREMRRAYAHATALEPDLVAALARAAAPGGDDLARGARAQPISRCCGRRSRRSLRLDPRGGGGQGGGARPRALRCAARWLRARPAHAPAIDALLEPLAAFLPDFLERVLARQARAAADSTGRFPAAGQKALGQRLMARARLRLRRTAAWTRALHPFCGGVPDDVRMTARYDESDVASRPDGDPARDRPRALQRRACPRPGAASRSASRARHGGAREPVAADRDAGLPLARRSSAIWRRCCARPSAATARRSRADNLYRQAIRVARGFIRVDADEVDLSAARHPALPAGEGAARGRSAGRRPARAPGTRACASCSASRRPTTALGCLQDIHWPAGAIGYFPCYTLGALMAAQLFQAIERGRARRARAASPRATSGRCSPGCAPTSTSRARATRRRSCSPAPPAARSSFSRSCATSRRATWRLSGQLRLLTCEHTLDNSGCRIIGPSVRARSIDRRAQPLRCALSLRLPAVGEFA